MWSGKGNIFLSFCGGTLIFSLCEAVFAEQTFYRHRKRVIFLKYEKQR